MLENLVVVDPEDHEDASHVVPRPSLRERLRDGLNRLDERFPAISEWVGGRLDIELPALAVSLVVHLAVLVVLGLIGLKVHSETVKPFEGTAAAVDTALNPNMEDTTFQDLDQSNEPPVEAALGSFAPNVATITVSSSASSAAPAPAPELDASSAVSLARLDVQRATDTLVPTASMFSQNVAIKGSGAEHVGSAEGAVDRTAQEILRRLEKGRTLVVWAFDASGSLQAERERLAKHIETIYTHIDQLDQEHRASEGGLLTMVVAFGESRKAMMDAPSDDHDAIARAIRSVPLDTTGIESTFTTVAEVVRKWGRYKDSKGNVYKTMIIVVTDEIGDDESALEDTIALATDRKYQVPVYVLGSQALFGRTEGRVNYTDPKSGRTFYNIPVRQGPESLLPEQIVLPFWYGGDQYAMLDSGFGPYALSRLAGATGGIYFVTRLGQTRQGFDPVAMREYKPDWVSRAQYESAVQTHPLRKAVIDAALLTQQQGLPGMPSLVFPPVDGTEFKEVMERNQAISAQTSYLVDAAIEPINAVVKLRDRETSRRWQAHYDLIRGRLMAMKVRSYEYNWACAQMKKDPLKFKKPDSNAWRLVPDTEIHFSDKAAAAARQATDLLKKVVAEHPNTPWALLAQRELKDPMGFKWVESYVKPIVRKESAEAVAKKKAQMKNMAKPEPPPKL